MEHYNLYTHCINLTNSLERATRSHSIINALFNHSDRVGSTQDIFNDRWFGISAYDVAFAGAEIDIASVRFNLCPVAVLGMLDWGG